MSSNTGGWEVKSLVGVHINTSQVRLANGSEAMHCQTETVKHITNCIPEQLASSVATSFHINHSQSPGRGPWGPVTVTTWEGSIEGPGGTVTVTTWEVSMGRPLVWPKRVLTWEESMLGCRDLLGMHITSYKHITMLPSMHAIKLYRAAPRCRIMQELVRT